MFDARLLMTGCSVYSPWMPRGGDNLIATLDVIDVSGGDVTVRVFTKNSEDPGDGDDANASVTIARDTVGRTSAEWEGVLDEWVRYKLTVAGSAGSWILFRMLPLVWFDTVDAT